MDVAVYGAGSLGSLLGGMLARTHDVTLVGRDPHVTAVRDAGLRVVGVEEFATTPRATTEGVDLAGDLALVTVKAYDTGTAAADLATGTFDAVLSLQNGMGNEAVLADRLACPVLGGTTTYGAMLREPGVVEWTGRGEVTVGPWEADGDLAGRVVEAFRDAGVTSAVDAAVRTVLWEKLAVNAAINPVTALARVENGVVFAGQTADTAAEAAREVARVARREGVELSGERAVERAREVADRTGANRSSMYRDVLAGRRTEIDAVSGFVVATGEERGVPVPVNHTLWALVRGWESGEGVR